jgi:cytoskeleton protein RodZ
MREAREHLGHDLASVARELRIREVYLQAIEDGRFDEVPGPTYVGGFIRSYALFLGLDPQDIMARYKVMNPVAEFCQDLVFPEPLESGLFPRPRLVIGSLVVTAIAFGVWLWWSNGDQPDTAAIPEVPARLESLIASTDEPAADTATSSVSTVADTASQIQTRDVMAAARLDRDESDQVGAAAAVSSADSDSASTATNNEAVVTATSTVAATSREATASAASTAGDVSQATGSAFGSIGELILTAEEDVWIEIGDRTGDIVLSRVLVAGESIRIPDDAGYVLTTGNAGGLRVQVGEQTTGPLGRAGEVWRDIGLVAQSLLDQSRN